MEIRWHLRNHASPRLALLARHDQRELCHEALLLEPGWSLSLEPAPPSASAGTDLLAVYTRRRPA